MRGLDDSKQDSFGVPLELKKRILPSWKFALAIAGMVVIKLWLTADIRILPFYSPHDALNFVEHAKFIMLGEWFGPYSDLTLIKQPFFPVYLAILSDFGLPLPLANQLLYALACLIACFAVRRIVRSDGVLLALFAVLLWNPLTYGALAWLPYRSQLSESLALLSLACATAILLRRADRVSALVPWSLGLGFSFAAFWLTREESVWLVPSVVTILAASLLSGVSRRRPQLLGAASLTFGCPLAICVAAVLVFKSLNGVHYGWFVTTEQSAPEYISAYNSLARIVSPTADRMVPVPKAARELAYSVSLAARELQPTLEGQIGKNWTAESCKGGNVCRDIGGGWFQWAFRDAVANAGYYTSGPRVQEFYVRLARELDAACDTGSIRCRAKRHTLAPPVGLSDVPVLAERAERGVLAVVTLSNFSIVSWASPNASYPIEIVADYVFVVRSVGTGSPNEYTADQRFKESLLSGIAGAYRALFPPWTILTVVLVTVSLVRRLRRRSIFIPDDVVIFIGACLSWAVLLAILSVIDMLWFPAISSPEYTTSLMPVLFLSFGLVTAANLRRGRPFVRTLLMKRR